jgi:hypothetical protein
MPINSNCFLCLTPSRQPFENLFTRHLWWSVSRLSSWSHSLPPRHRAEGHPSQSPAFTLQGTTMEGSCLSVECSIQFTGASPLWPPQESVEREHWSCTESHKSYISKSKQYNPKQTVIPTL